MGHIACAGSCQPGGGTRCLGGVHRILGVIQQADGKLVLSLYPGQLRSLRVAPAE